MTENKKAKYQKPRIKSSKITSVSFYTRGTIRTGADAEQFLLARIIC